MIKKLNAAIIKLTFLIIFAVLFAACDGNDNSAPTYSNFETKITGAINVDYNALASIVNETNSKKMIVSARTLDGVKYSLLIKLYFNTSAPVPGEYPFVGDPDSYAGDCAFAQFEVGQNEKFYYSIDGSIKITSITDTGIYGSFEFTGKNNSDDSKIDAKEGVISVNTL